MKVKPIVFFRIASIFFIIMISSGTIKAENNSPDLSNHPMYAGYEFSKEEGVINIGTQPLYFPTGLICEMMKRDIVLQTALSELGMELRFYAFLKGNDVNFFLGRGELDAGIGGDMPVLRASANFDIVITNLMQLGFTSIVAREHMLMKNLRGKKLAYALGSNAHYSLMQALSGAGLNEKDVYLISMDISDMPEALYRKKIDAFSGWEPTVSVTLKRYKNAIVIHRNLNSGYLYFLKDFSIRHHEAMYQIVASVIRAVYWLQESDRNLLRGVSFSKESGEELVASFLEPISNREIAELAKKDIIGMRQPFRIPASMLKTNAALYNQLDFLKSIGKIQKAADWDNIINSFDTQIVKKILLNPKKYRLREFSYVGGEDSDE